MSKVFTWKTRWVKRETDDAVTIFFDTLGERFDFKAGQFVNLSININGDTVSRSYSLSSSPFDNEPSITVKAIKDGLVSNYIVSEAEKIREWTVEGPNGFFHPKEETLQLPAIVLIGGGSGITALFSQLKFLLEKTMAPVFLINVNRTPADVIFREELRLLEEKYSARFSVTSFYTKASAEDIRDPNREFRGRPGKLLLKKLLKQLLSGKTAEAAYFLCGPAGLIELAEDAIRSLNVEEENIYKEYFAPAENDEPGPALPDAMMEVLIHHFEQTNLLEVQPGKTILDAALEDRMPIRYSCRNGTCGSCAARLLNGNVHMKQNYALGKEQLDKGYVLLCQSHPLDNQVEVEVGVPE